MKAPFRRAGDVVRMELEEFEVHLLRELPAGLRALLELPDGDDPVLNRLFPRAVVGSDDDDVELRRLMYDDLLQSRLEGLDALAAILDRGWLHRGRLRVDLIGDEPELFLGVLNDVRLTIGVRVGIEHIDREQVDEDHPALPMLAVMDHLAWMQEQLLRVIDPGSVFEAEV